MKFLMSLCELRGIYKLKFYFNFKEMIKMSQKLVIDNETYVMMRNKQTELIKKTHQHIKLEDITKISLQTIVDSVYIESDKKGWILVVSPKVLICDKCKKVFIPQKDTDYEKECEGDFRGVYCWNCITGESENIIMIPKEEPKRIMTIKDAFAPTLKRIKEDELHDSNVKLGIKPDKCHYCGKQFLAEKDGSSECYIDENNHIGYACNECMDKF